MRLRVITFLMMIILLTTSFTAFAKEIYDLESPICVKVNGTYLNMDAEPFMVNNRTYVPIRALGEALGANVYWNAGTQTATIQKADTTIQMQDGAAYATVNGTKKYLENGIKKREDRLFVPARFVAETFSAYVDWDEMSYTVNVYKDGISVPSYLQSSRSYSDDEIFWLARIIYAESQGEPMSGKIAVANTVLNRVKSSEFPDTIYGVIFDRKYAVQYEPTFNGTIYNTPDAQSVAAAKRALEGESIVDDCLYFLNPRKATNSWIIRNRPYYMTIGNHDFYR